MEAKAASPVEDTRSEVKPQPQMDSVNNVATEEAKEEESDDTDEEKAPALKYKYKEDQWSPLNPEGKMQYDRDFLLQLQYSKVSLKKPDMLPNFPEIIPDRPTTKPDSGMRSGGGNYRDLPDFTPGFLRPSRGMSERGSQGGGGGSMSKRGRQQRNRGDLGVNVSIQFGTLKGEKANDEQVSTDLTDSIQEEEELLYAKSVPVDVADTLVGDNTFRDGNQPLPDHHKQEPNILAAAPLPWCDLDPEKVVQVLSRLKNPMGGAVEILMKIPALKSSGEDSLKEKVLKSLGEGTREEVVEEQGMETVSKKEEIKEQKDEITRKTLTIPPDERELYRKARGILNKLTPQKFQTLIKQVEGLVIDTETKLKGFTTVVWEQSTRDTAYAKEYASLCTHLMKIEVPSELKKGVCLRFRMVLLILCRKSFTKIIDYAENSIEEKGSTGKWHEITKQRRKYVGIVRFMGELFQHEMLLEKIIIDCLSKLLQSGNEILLECFCHLMFVVGETLDQRHKLDDYFQQIKEILSEKKVSARCSFMFQDVIDLRHNNWKPLRHRNIPITIDEIHRQVYLEEAREAALGRHGGQAGGSMEEGRNPVSSKAIRNIDRNIDVSKLRIEKNADENIQLGPARSFGGWGRGTSGGGSRASQEGEKPKAPGNRYD